jgi:hypothetical protein
MKKLLTIAALIISSMGIAQEDGINSKVYLLKSKDEVKRILKNEKCTFEIMNGDGFIIYCYCNGKYIELWFDEEDECIATIKHVKDDE